MNDAVINKFITGVMAVLNRNLFVRIGVYCLCAVSILSLLWAIGFRVFGYPAPVWGFFVIALIGLGTVASEYVTQKKDEEKASQEADAVFQLKDSLTTALHFEKDDREGEVIELQRKQTSSLIQALDPSALRARFPQHLAIGSVVVLILAMVIGSLAPSAAVQTELMERAETEERTQVAKDQLEEFVKELLSEVDEKELEALGVEDLKKWIKELKQTDDRKDAMRQFAKLEQKIAGAMQSLEQRRDEQFMKMAAYELEKSDKAEARQLGKQLDAKKFKKAAEKLMEMKQAQMDVKKGMKFGDKQKKLARLRAMSRRMAAAASQPNIRAFSQDQRDPMEQIDMGQMMQQLDENAEMAQEQLEKMLGRQEVSDEELEKMLAEVDGDLDKLADRLKRMNARKKMKNHLGKLRRGLGKAQSFAMGRSQKLNLGKSPGTGTDERRRDQRDEFRDNGNTDRLTGRKGIGPALTTIEDATDGTGVSGRQGDEKVERSFQRQFESFVRRDDVSEEMKIGVREYFERIHQVEDFPRDDTSE